MIELSHVLVAGVFLAMGLVAGLQIFRAQLKKETERVSYFDRELAAAYKRENEISLVAQQAGMKLEEATRVIKNLAGENETLHHTVEFQKAQYDKLLSQKKSSEVRVGLVTEQIAPFLENYPEDPNTARFLGEPIDFVHFNSDKIVFVEVKSGRSQLNKRQRQIRDMIKEGKVEFEIYRVKGE